MQQRAFTLIELIVVIAIAGILVALAYPSYVQYVVKSKRKAAESFTSRSLFLLIIGNPKVVRPWDFLLAND